jgi:cytochrome c553
VFTRLFSTIFGATVIFAAVAVPAAAADVNEAKVRVCNSCHGPDGVPPSPTTPIIWGQQLNYLVKQMRDYRSGDRNNSPIMSAIVRDVQEDDAPKLAAYYAAKSWPARQAAAATAAALPAAPPQGIADKIETCRACHAQNFEGGAPAPRLAGLSYEYLVASMKSFADGRRTNNADMPGLMKALTESERDAMAKYLAGL